MSLDRASVARLQAGDINGLAGLVETYQIPAIRTAYLIARDRSLAEDIVQAAFIRAYERIAQFDTEAPFGPWFLRSVANDAIKAVERTRRIVSADTASDGEDGQPDLVLVDEALGPAALVELAEDAAALWALLGRLPPKQRAVIVLRYYVGLTDAEIADRLDTPAATVRWRLHAARGRLRGWLGARAE
ncbi:MAG TPA: sigma-70 family RNA polymerase sigma factor [Candidatus Acidoferrum sp.]|nr:sigma-70 family RNA polymerase sigma factor [Candidatus Acidoferrum sp.]